VLWERHFKSNAVPLRIIRAFARPTPDMATSHPTDSYPTVADAPLVRTLSTSLSIRKSEDSSVKADDLVEHGPPQFRVIDWMLGRRPKYDLDSIATRRSVFDDPKLAEHYHPTPQYENLSRFDPSARWTHREEQVRPFIFIEEYYL
jgi:hypothetical protein